MTVGTIHSNRNGDRGNLLIDRVPVITPESVAEEDRHRAATEALLTAPVDDDGHARCVQLRYPDRFLQNQTHGWLQNTGTHWTAVGAEEALWRAIVETLRARTDAALRSGRANEYNDLIRQSVPDTRNVGSCRTMFASIAGADISEFDANPDALNCINGVIDLQTGTLRPHSLGDRFLHCIPTTYNPQADQTKWTNWLIDTVGAEAADWLQIAVGYSLTGRTEEEVLFYLFGPTRSGKGTFTETLLAMLGEPLSSEINFSTFTARRDGDSQNFDLAPLRPCRLIAASESNAYERFNEAKIKAMTGGNRIYCAFKHKSHFSYRPMFKIWLSSNHPVNADPDDDAVWGRVRIVSFPTSRLGKEDKRLKRTLQSKASLRGVLAWAVAGAMRWYALGSQGLPELASSVTLKTDQRSEIDHVAMWLDECCATVHSALAEKRAALADGRVADAEEAHEQAKLLGASVASNKAIFASYELWCKDNGFTAKRQKGLTQALKHKDYVIASNPVRINGEKIRGVYGIRITE